MFVKFQFQYIANYLQGYNKNNKIPTVRYFNMSIYLFRAHTKRYNKIPKRDHFNKSLFIRVSFDLQTLFTVHKFPLSHV